MSCGGYKLSVNLVLPVPGADFGASADQTRGRRAIASGESLMTNRKVSLSLSLGLYFVGYQGTALVQPVGELQTYVWTTYYQTPGFISAAKPVGPRAADKTDCESREELNEESTP